MPMNRRCLQVLLAYLIARRRKSKRTRSMYARDIYLNRCVQGELFLVKELSLDNSLHRTYFRMDKASFDYILEKIEPHLFHFPTHRRPITAVERLAITLRYLATGSTQKDIAFNFRASSLSVCNIVREVMTAICQTMEAEFLSEPDEAEWLAIAKEFEEKWSFPMCMGAIDGKHVKIKAPAHTCSQYRNYKGFFSIVLLGVADANYVFRLVDIGMSGSNSDGGILKRSPLGRKLENRNFRFPEPKKLSTGKVVPAVLIGDDAFPLKSYMMKPFSDGSEDSNIFNYRLSRARMVIENAFGILAARWRIFHTLMEAKPGLAALTTKTAVILHNFLMKRNDCSAVCGDVVQGEQVIPGNWRQLEQTTSNVTKISRQGSNNSSTDAFTIRGNFKEFFLSPAGSLSWQRKYVLRGYE